MLTLKAFAQNSQLADNTPGVVSVLGELSTYSSTFAREKSSYPSNAMPTVTLVAFTCKQDGTTTTLSNALAEHVNDVAGAVYSYMFDKGGQIYSDELIDMLTLAFTGIADTFRCGSIVNAGSTLFGPEWLQWQATGVDGVGANTLKVWFSDQAFQLQYDDYEIVVIPPVLNLNDFFKNAVEVQAAISALTPSRIIERVQEAKTGHPETVMRAETFDYIDPFNATHKIAATWNVLIYGAAGNNIDAVIDAISEHAIANSTHTRAQWSPLIPDLFKRTEFVLVPMWDQYAIPNLSIYAGIYSPIANLKRATALMKQVLVNFLTYPEAHINDHLTIMSHPYKSLQVLTVGSPDNRDALFDLNQVFKDIIAVSTTSNDFGRMSSTTKEFLLLLNEMIMACEDLTEFSEVPTGYTKTVRNGMVFLVKRYNNINYLVSARANTPVVITGE